MSLFKMINCFTALFEFKKFSQASVFSCLKIFHSLSHFFLVQRIYILCPKDKPHYFELTIRTVPVSSNKIILKSGITINRETRNDQGEMILSERFKCCTNFTP